MTCDKCGDDKSDVMPRLFDGEVLKGRGFVKKDTITRKETTFDPALCTACCAEMPGREWMRA